MAPAVQRYRVSFRIYVMLSMLMAASATTSGLYLLYLARPFVVGTSVAHEKEATVTLFLGAAITGGMAALTGLLVGIQFASRIRGIIAKAEAVSPPLDEAPQGRVLDELGALDEAVGRLTLSVDQFVQDSEILARLPEGMLLLGSDGSLRSFNTTAGALLDLSLEQARGKAIFSAGGLFPLEKGNEPLAQLLKEMEREDLSLGSGEIPVTTATGRSFLLEVTAQRRHGAPDSSLLVLLFRDASEKRRIREEIRRTDQLAFLGEMAARVAHEIRTPLATIRGLVELLQADLAMSDPRRAYIDRILQGVERQNQLVENLLTLTNPEPETREVIFLRELLDEVLSVMPHDARLTVKISEFAGPLRVWGDPSRLSEVFMNLIQNALEATPESGSVEIRVEPGAPKHALVMVRNTGVGIPKELQERIFHPFFTTKLRGTGLGLAIARQIVTAHGGRILVESDGNSETVFVVELPTPSSAPATTVVAPLTLSSPPAGERDNISEAFAPGGGEGPGEGEVG